MRRFWNQRIFVGGQRLSTLLFACCFLLFNGLSETLSPEPYKRDDILQKRPMLFNGLSETLSPEPYKRDDILQKRLMLFNGLSETLHVFFCLNLLSLKSFQHLNEALC